MRLKKAQKEKLLELVASGLRTDEINEQAALFEPPFSVSRQQVDFYRTTRRTDIQAIEAIGEKTALIAGYSQKEHRVYKLSMLAALMERDLFGGFLWLDQVKGVGSGDIAQIVEYEEFNSAEITQYRGVLDDIAREVGARAVKQEVTGADGGPVALTWAEFVKGNVPDDSTR